MAGIILYQPTTSDDESRTRETVLSSERLTARANKEFQPRPNRNFAFDSFLLTDDLHDYGPMASKTRCDRLRRCS